MGRIIFEGLLKKSPPQSKIKKESSWKLRYFVLAEIGVNDQYSPKSKMVGKEETYGTYLMYWENQHDRRKGKTPLSKNEDIRVCFRTTAWILPFNIFIIEYRPVLAVECCRGW